MTEKSYFWADTTIGDGIYSSYTDDEYSDIWRKLFQRDRTLMGVIEDYLNELLVTGAASPLNVATGAALVDGKYYENDAATTVAYVGAPLVNPRWDRIVLRKSWANRTVRLAWLQASIEGNPEPTTIAMNPALTQTDGTTWEIPLYRFQVAVGGAISSITSEISFCRSPLSMATTSALTLIQTISSDGTSTNIDFQNIPSTYRHLMILGRARTAGAAVDALMTMQFNGDAAGNYQSESINGSNAGATATNSLTTLQVGYIPANNATANHAGSFEIFIPDYKNSGFYKNMIASVIDIPSNAVAAFRINNYGGAWRNNNAITRVNLVSAGGNFMAGSIASLYGVL